MSGVKKMKWKIAVLVFVALFFTADAFATLESIGSVTRVARSKPNAIILDTTSRARVQIEFFDIDVIRIRVAPSRHIRTGFLVRDRLLVRTATHPKRRFRRHRSR
jgi:hypothetical protein